MKRYAIVFLALLAFLGLGASEAAAQYDCRWDQIGGSWTTGWVPDHTTPYCGHQAPGCACGGQNYCGSYASGSATRWWPQGCGGPQWTIRCRCRHAQAVLYKCRWDQIGGSWTTGWVRDHTTPYCGHQAPGCACGGQNFCGSYPSGATTSWWPRGCGGPRWAIKCSCAQQR